jgi:hypothetical protein
MTRSSSIKLDRQVVPSLALLSTFFNSLDFSVDASLLVVICNTLFRSALHLQLQSIILQIQSYDPETSSMTGSARKC